MIFSGCELSTFRDLLYCAARVYSIGRDVAAMRFLCLQVYVCRFMYTDQIELEPHLVMHIWYLAKKYLLSTLEVRCIDYLDHEVTPANAAIIYDQCRFFDEHQLMKKCLRILSLQTRQCLVAPSMLDISKATLRALVDLPVITCDELCLFQACCSWAKHHCEENNITATSQDMKLELCDVIDRIRFRTMESDLFRSHVIPAGLLTVEQVDEIIRYFENNPQPTPNRRQYQGGERIELHDMSVAMLQVSGPVAEYNIDVSVDCHVLLHYVTLYDSEARYDHPMPLGNECLHTQLTLNGAEIFADYCNKKNTTLKQNIKQIPTYAMTLKAGTHRFGVKYTWKGRCVHCGHFAQCGLTVGAQFCYNCGNFSGLRPKPISIGKLCTVELESAFVTIRLQNTTNEHAMPFVGFVFSDPRPP